MHNYRIKKGMILQKLDDRTAIFDSNKSTLFTFNETATFVFSKLKSGWDRNKIIAVMIKRYGIVEKRAIKDFDNFLEELRRQMIIF